MSQHLQGPTLIDADLVVDPEALFEMSADGVEIAERAVRTRGAEPVSDATFKGCRFLLTQRSIESVQVNSQPALRVELHCSLHPAQHSRLTWIDLAFSFPASTTVLSFVPEIEYFPTPVKHSQSIKATAEGEVGGAKFGLEGNSGREFAESLWKLQGSGEGAHRLRWTMREHPHSRTGIVGHDSLQFVIDQAGPAQCEVLISAQAAFAGLAGLPERVFALLARPTPDQRRYQLTFGT